jgi:16S rRNA (guanine1207-N2)-methyltransferase
MSVRLTLALDAGGLILPEAGTIAVLLPSPDADLSALPADRLRIEQPFRPYFDHFAAQGLDCQPTSDAACAAAIVLLPRAKAQARAAVADACARASDLVVVDGAKVDGIDSLWRDIRARVPVEGPISKAHGKVFWFRPDRAAFADWAAPSQSRADGYVTAPGVFSADGIDPASALLAAALPAQVGRHVADLGAGWGYLSAGLLADPKLETLHAVEADHVALACARANLTDPRVQFHWADARTWTPPKKLDAVVCNPPFHISRAADAGLGQDFIAAAAGMLTPGGILWLVANRHLPYEAALTTRFADVREVAGGDGRFKIIRAARPARPRR